MLELSPGLAFALVGAVIGILSYIFISGALAEAIAERDARRGEWWKFLAVSDLVMYPVIGYIVGTYFF